MTGVLAADSTLSDFNQLIWWMVLLKVGIVFLFLLLHHDLHDLVRAARDRPHAEQVRA